MLVEYPKVAESLIQTAEVRKEKNLQSLQELADILEVVEIRKDSTYEDLAGRASLTPELNLDPRVSNDAPEDNELKSKLIIEDMQTECKRLQTAVVDIQQTASKILQCLSTPDHPPKGFKLPPLQAPRPQS